MEIPRVIVGEEIATPASRLIHDRRSNFVDAPHIIRSGPVPLRMSGIPQRVSGGGIGIENPAVEKRLLEMVGITKPKLSIVPQAVVNRGGRTAGIGGGEIAVRAFKNVLGIPNDELEGFAGSALAEDVPVVVRPIFIPSPVIDDHVIDEVIDIHELQKLLVLKVIRETGIREGQRL